MSRFSRRGFIKTGITGATGAMAISPFISSSGILPERSNLAYRTLGKTKLKVPVVSFGVMSADNHALCKAAHDSGISLFDTANAYQHGKSESMLGGLFKDTPRDSFLISTKVKPAGIGSDGLPTNRTTPEDLLEKFYSSLSRLGLDYVDFLLVQDVSNPEFLEYKPVLNALRSLKKQKKAMYIGFSTHGNMAEIINTAADSNVWDIILTSYNFKLENINEMNAALSKANNCGLGIMTNMALAGGGFLDKERTRPLNTAAALKWVLSNRDVHTVITGMTSFDHLESNLTILEDITMTGKEKKDLLIAGKDTGLFCTGCMKCLPLCPFNLPVPDLMRAYMYAHGYSSLPMAYSLLGELGTGSSPCINCDTCKIECTKKFNIKEKISDISRLVGVPADFIV